jgi:hypothetical protein
MLPDPVPAISRFRTRLFHKNRTFEVSVYDTWIVCRSGFSLGKYRRRRQHSLLSVQNFLLSQCLRNTLYSLMIAKEMRPSNILPTSIPRPSTSGQCLLRVAWFPCACALVLLFSCGSGGISFLTRSSISIASYPTCILLWFVSLSFSLSL